MKNTLRIALLLASGAAATLASAADACSNYKWDVTREVQLFATPPVAVTVGTDTGNAPLIEAGKHYALALHPQETVRYVVAPSKPMLGDGAFGGVLKLKVPAAGAHRVAIDAGFWLDVVSDGKPLATVDFNGSRECNGPRKIVVFDLPAGSELTVQLAASSSKAARLTVTPVAATPAP